MPEEPDWSKPPRLTALEPTASLVKAAKAWRTAEKRHAAIVLGIVEGDKHRAKDIANRALHALRIVADKCETTPKA